MSEQPQEPQRNRALEILGPALIAAALGAVVAWVATAHFADAEARAMQIASEALLERTRSADAIREANLNAIIKKERDYHAQHDLKRDNHFSAFATHAAGVRDALQAKLEGSLRAGETLASRLAGISQDVGELIELLDRGAGMVRRNRAEIGRLEAENGSLASKVTELQDEYRACHPERITVTGQKK